MYSLQKNILGLKNILYFVNYEIENKYIAKMIVFIIKIPKQFLYWV